MSIFPLPVFEAEADPELRASLTDEEIYARLQAPKTIVVRYGGMKLVGEFASDGVIKPGCGSKLIIRTSRGTELAEMLTTTCANSGCSKSVSRQEMLEYIENSGGRDYPFHTDGRILRVATIEDLNHWSAVQAKAREWLRPVRAIVQQHALVMKVVELELLFGEEALIVYYTSEDRVDFRELIKHLAGEFRTRIEMRQVGARDEARLVADYERCGQHCCCKNFLKVLKPVSMKSAKVQKATLDPLKISGRCGRLMCCLRYEDETYTDLAKRLPRLKSRVGTSEGPGIVVETKILVQLALVRLEADGREIAVPVEELMHPDECPRPEAPGATPAVGTGDPLRGMTPDRVRQRAGGGAPPQRGGPRGRGEGEGRHAAPGAPEQRGPREQRQDAFRERSQRAEGAPAGGERAPSPEGHPADGPPSEGGGGRRRRRRRRPGGRAAAGEAAGQSGASPAPEVPGIPQGEAERDQSTDSQPSAVGADGVKKRRRRRGRRRGSRGGGGAPGAPGDAGGSGE